MLILVVDDEQSLCDLMAEILKDNYDVIQAYDGKEALEMARQRQPDLVVSDIMMPHMSGVELVKALRDDPKTKDIPTILLSAATPQYMAREADAFVKKPFEIEVLEKIVAEIAKSKLPRLLEVENYSMKPPKISTAIPHFNSKQNNGIKSNFSFNS